MSSYTNFENMFSTPVNATGPSSDIVDSWVAPTPIPLSFESPDVLETVMDLREKLANKDFKIQELERHLRFYKEENASMKRPFYKSPPPSKMHRLPLGSVVLSQQLDLLAAEMDQELEEENSRLEDARSESIAFELSKWD